MARLHDKDKQLLGDAGLALSDAAYVEAVAGAGLQRRKPKFHAGPGGVVWSTVPRWRRSNEARAPKWSRRELIGFIRKWHDVQAKTPLPRVVIDPDPVWPPDVDVFSLFRIFGRLEAHTRSVFLTAPPTQADLRFQMPMRIGAWQEDYDALGLESVAATWPASGFMKFYPLSREHARYEVLILRGTLRTALQQILASPFAVRAGFVMLIGPADPPWRRMSSLASTLLSETQAAGLSLITLQSASELAGRLVTWAFKISHNDPFDVGLKTAFGDVAVLHLLSPQLIEAAALPTLARMLGRRLGALPTTAAFRLPQQTLHRIDLKSGFREVAVAPLPSALGRELRNRALTLPYSKESEGATALAEISTAENEARAAAAASQPNRILQADVYAIRGGKAIKNTRAFVVGLPHRVEVLIGPPGGGALQADELFPDKMLDWQNADQFTLGVIFSEPNQWDAPQIGELVLGRYGTSTPCRFDFTPTKIGRFRARLTIHYRGRVLQTALLKTRVTASRKAAAAVRATAHLSVETQIHGSLTTLDDRRRFDANLVLNRSVDGRRTMQAAGREGAFIRSLQDIKQQLAKISAHLRDVANEAKRYSKGLESKDCTDMLIKLATEGRELYGHLVLDGFERSAAARELGKSEYLQIVTTKPDAVVPLELVYEYAFPADDAKLCPRTLEALGKGRCADNCDVRSSPAPHVCPMGFWGLSKVIERHAHSQDLGAAAFVEAVEPIGMRSEIPLKGAALLAASNKVTAPARQKLETAVVKQWQPSGAVKSVAKWTEWKQAVGDVKPTLLVALPHSSGAGTHISLEISGDTFETRFINKDYLQPVEEKPPPLVLLMGCDVAGAGDARSYTSHVRYFRHGGAPVILGTLAIIEGGNAATVAGVLVEQLVKVVSSKPDRFGEVLRETKREAMKKGLLMVLGLVGFGDADWHLRL